MCVHFSTRFPSRVTRSYTAFLSSKTNWNGILTKSISMDFYLHAYPILDIFWHIAQVFVLSLRCRPASHWLMCFRKIPAAAKTKNTLKYHSREVSSSTFLLFQTRSPQLGIFKWKKGKGKLKKISQAKTTPLWNSSRPNSPFQVILDPVSCYPAGAWPHSETALDFKSTNKMHSTQVYLKIWKILLVPRFWGPTREVKSAISRGKMRVVARGCQSIIWYRDISPRNSEWWATS